MIERGANVNAKSNEGMTPLHLVAPVMAVGGKLEYAMLLIENGADISAKNSAGDTPLDIIVKVSSIITDTALNVIHRAALLGNLEAQETLGVLYFQRKNYTPLDLARNSKIAMSYAMEHILSGKKILHSPIEVSPVTNRGWLIYLGGLIFIFLVILGSLGFLPGVIVISLVAFYAILLIIFALYVIFLLVSAACEQCKQRVCCTNCGHSISRWTGVCPSCGANPTAHRKFCRQCGTALNPEQVVCVQCKANTVNQTEEQWAVWSLVGGVVFGILCISASVNMTNPHPLMVWLGIAAIVLSIARFLVKLVKMSKK